MNARAAAPSASTQERDAAERHNRVLLHALQTAHPVLHLGLKHFIHTLRFSDGGTDVTVYLMGNATPIDGTTITLAPLVDQPQTEKA